MVLMAFPNVRPDTSSSFRVDAWASAENTDDGRVDDIRAASRALARAMQTQ